MSFEDFAEEYETRLIGDHIYARVRLLASRLLRRRDPRVYARGAYDYRDGLEDVVNDFVLHVLIEERQLDYVMATAIDLPSFDRLIRRQLRRYLARTRTRTVIDNLIDRSLRELRTNPFAVDGTGDAWVFSIDSDLDPTRRASEGAIRHAAALAQAIPKDVSQADERAPRVYDRDGLRTVLVLLCRHVNAWVSRRDLQIFFEHLLTAWAPSFLGPMEEYEVPSSAMAPSEEVMVIELAAEIAESMSDEERVIFRYKSANLPDRDLAERLGLSRQSTVPRKQVLFARLMNELTDVDPSLRPQVLARLTTLLASTEGQPDDS